jgi:hypothetical protein
MLKRYSQFINESNVPGPNTEGSLKLNISEEEVNLFSEEPSLQKLISDQKVALFDKEVWFNSSDNNTKEILDQYLEISESVDLSKSTKYVKKFDEALAGHMGAVHSATRNMKSASGEELSDKADEFSLSICTNPIYRKFANYNYKLKEVEIDKVEPKKGFMSKLFSGNSTIDFTFEKVKDNSKAFMTVKLKGEKFILANSTTTENTMATIPDDEQAKKFINYLVGQSQWKDELVKNFENIKDILTSESVK